MRRNSYITLMIFTALFVCLSFHTQAHAQNQPPNHCFKFNEGGWFEFVAMPTTMLVGIATITANSIALGKQKARLGIGIASLVLSTAGLVNSLASIDWRPCSPTGIALQIFMTLPYLSFISYSIFTLLMEKHPAIATHVGIWSGVGAFTGTWIAVIALTTAGLDFTHSLFGLLPSMGFAIALFTAGMVSHTLRKKEKKISISPWFAPEREAHGIRGGVMMAGTF